MLALLRLALLGSLAAIVVPAGSAEAATPRIFFSDFDDGARSLFSIRADGERRRRVTRSPGIDGSPSWSQRRRRLVFFRRATGTARLYTVRASGRGLRRIPRTRHAVDPAWSPGGRRIAFAMARSEGGSAIFTIRPHGRGLRRLTRYRGHGQPAWSPSGRSIAYVAAGGKIVRMRANGARKRVVVRGDAPDWSPDGRRIAYVGYNRRTRAYEIFTVRPDGSGRRSVTRDLEVPCAVDDEVCGHEDATPAWSPGGRRIAFATTLGGGAATGGIWTIRPDGSGARRISRRGEEPDW